MFFVVLVYAITVHKSQGLTLDKVVLDISTKDHTLGLTYVAISSVRTIQGLCLKNPFIYLTDSLCDPRYVGE